MEKYLIKPQAIIQDKRLTSTESDYLCLIFQLCNANGCTASNQYFADYFGVSRARATQVIAELRRKGFITTQEQKSGGKTIERTITIIDHNSKESLSSNGKESELKLSNGKEILPSNGKESLSNTGFMARKPYHPMVRNPNFDGKKTYNHTLEETIDNTKEKKENNKKKEKKEISPFFADAEPSQDATILDDWDETEATEYVFVLQDGSQWYLPDEKFTEYNRTFVDIDVAAELRKAAQWLRDNPGRRKTARGMPRFLSGWLGRVESKKPAKALRELPEANFRAVFNKLGVPRDIQDKLEAEGWTV
jgi:DNA-binding MarR family transcriptional regulator